MEGRGWRGGDGGEDFFPILYSFPSIGLNGIHQQYNAALAIALSQVWLTSSPKSKLQPSKSDFTPNTNNYVTSLAQPLPGYFTNGLTKTRWAGRAQIIKLPDHPNLTICILSIYLLIFYF